MTPERKAEIKAATPENPIRLTPEEEAELREESAHRFQMNVGAGRFHLKAKPGTPAAEALALQHKGMNTAAIARQLEFSESSMARMLKLVY